MHIEVGEVPPPISSKSNGNVLVDVCRKKAVDLVVKNLAHGAVRTGPPHPVGGARLREAQLGETRLFVQFDLRRRLRSGRREEHRLGVGVVRDDNDVHQRAIPCAHAQNQLVPSGAKMPAAHGFGSNGRVRRKYRIDQSACPQRRIRFTPVANVNSGVRNGPMEVDRESSRIHGGTARFSRDTELKRTPVYKAAFPSLTRPECVGHHPRMHLLIAAEEPCVTHRI